MTIPFLVEMGYEKIFAASIVTVAGGLGVIIPPSISYIVYSSATGTSPSDLFIAGIVPGILIGAALMFYCWIYCKRHGEDKELLMAHYKAIREKGFMKVFKESFWALLTPVIILGSIYGGIASPTEAAVISVVYGLVVCIFIYKTIPIRKIGTVFIDGAKTYVNILFVIAAATAFARCMTLLRYPQAISSAVLASVDNKILILLVMNIIMLVCGMIIDNIPNIMILTPILLPIATAVGVSPVHFGIIMTVNLAIGMVTPPMEAMLVGYLGGRAAEELVFDTVTTGAANDIEQATKVARAMITQYGMSEKFGLMGLATQENQYLSGRAVLNCGDDTATEVDHEVMVLLHNSYEEAKRLIGGHREALDKIANYLIRRETITGKEFMKIFRAVERGLEIPENLDDLEIPEKTETKPEEPVTKQMDQTETEQTIADQTTVPDSDVKENTVTLDKTEIQ